MDPVKYIVVMPSDEPTESPMAPPKRFIRKIRPSPRFTRLPAPEDTNLTDTVIEFINLWELNNCRELLHS